MSAPLPGMVTFIQRSGSALNANLHLHILALDGVYVDPGVEETAPRLHPLAGPSDEDVGLVVEKIAQRTVKLLRRLGYLDSEAEFVMRPDADDMFQDNAAITAALGASVQSKIAFGPRAGQFVRKIGKGFGYEEETPLVKGVKCATINGFNLHAAVFVADPSAPAPGAAHRLYDPPADRQRPPEHYREMATCSTPLKRRFADGTEAILLSPTELIEKICAMVPPPKAHQILYTGVFSSHSRWRNLVVLDPEGAQGL